MIVVIHEDQCEHLAALSHYNHNYYKLPFKVNDCDTVFASYDGADNFNGHELGNIVDGKFEVKFYLHTYDKDDSTFIFDSKELSETNKWT